MSNSNLVYAVNGTSVNYHLLWGMPHTGDYDILELFGWMKKIRVIN